MVPPDGRLVYRRRVGFAKVRRAPLSHGPFRIIVRSRTVRQRFPIYPSCFRWRNGIPTPENPGPACPRKLCVLASSDIQRSTMTLESNAAPSLSM